MIFKGHKFDIEIRMPYTFRDQCIPTLRQEGHEQVRTPHEKGIILYLTDSNTHNMIVWIPGRNTVATIN